MVKKITIRDLSFLVEDQSYKDYWKQVADGSWEQRTYEIFDQFLAKDASYIDIGAWIGSTVLYGCQLSRRTFAVEPDPVAHEALSANIDANPLHKDAITVFRGCISSSDGTENIGFRTEAGDSTSSVLFGEGDNQWEVEALTLDTFVTRYQIDDLNFIKIDIEGGEFKVLRSMKPFLQQHLPVVHLSIHTPFLKRDYPLLERMLKPRFIYKAFKGLLNLPRLMLATVSLHRMISCYHYIYDEEGRRLNLLGLISRFNRFHSILLMNETWDSSES